MYARYLNLPKLLEKKSILLLGPRQTGKSTLVKSSFPGAPYVDLSRADTFRELSARPELLRERLAQSTRIFIIDEAQLLPELFNEVQVMLDGDFHLRALLTGSSARKLKRKEVNLLPGRIWQQELHPLVSPDLGSPRIRDRISRGSLPGIIDSPHYPEELRSFVGLYLEEEIRHEALTRNIGAFSRFLEAAALSNGEQLSYRNVSHDTSIPESTVKSYFQILGDTLIGTLLPAYRKTKSRKAAATPKFYFFDWGVVNALLNRFDVSEESDTFGKALEHLIFQELQAYLAYSRDFRKLSYWRSLSKFEVDFVVGDDVAIEVKAKRLTSARDYRGLLALAEEIPLKRKIVVCRESARRRTEEKIEVIPVTEFLTELWAGGIL